MKLLQINIEYDKHLDLVHDFIKRENPDIVCMQEVFENDFNKFTSSFDFFSTYVPMNILNDKKRGLAIYSKYPLNNICTEYYYKPTEEVTTLIKTQTQLEEHELLLSAEIEINGSTYNIFTTHFPVNYPGHEVSELQKGRFKAMNSILKTKKGLILTGDTNCPRGTEIFDSLARDYKDNIPEDTMTTIDKKLHRAGFLPYVVDCLFTTPDYIVTNIKLVSGVSDHLGIVAEIEKV